MLLSMVGKVVMLCINIMRFKKTHICKCVYVYYVNPNQLRKHFFEQNTMVYPKENSDIARMELANRLFFRLYQCANMLHKTGTRAVEKEGLTTQQWAVLGALSRTDAEGGMSVGDLARYLKVSRQNLSGQIGRMERDGHIELLADTRDRRAKRVTMTKHGRKIWEKDARPKIRTYYEAALTDFSTGDLTHTLHYLIKLLDNMEKIDQSLGPSKEDE
jgi:DNA-binding MarR family transcriptional regulator